MLAMSRLSSDALGDAFFLANHGVTQLLDEDSSFAARLVAALEMGEIAALVLDCTSGTTVAANALVAKHIKEPQAARDLKKCVLSDTSTELRSFVWRGAEDATLIVRRSSIAGCNRPFLLVLLIEPRRDEVLLFDAFLTRYGVTSAEARVLSGLIAGEGLASIAKQHNISLSTVKTQMQSLLIRTGSRRQASLVALYFSGSW